MCFVVHPQPFVPCAVGPHLNTVAMTHATVPLAGVLRPLLDYGTRGRLSRSFGHCLRLALCALSASLGLGLSLWRWQRRLFLLLFFRKSLPLSFSFPLALLF